MSPTELDDAAEELLERLASGPTAAIGLTKQALSFGQHATLGQSITEELFNLELSCRTADFKEGLEAFRQRRAPIIRADEGSRMPTDSFDTINYDVDGHKATITLNRPEALNALSPYMITELRAADDEAENGDNDMAAGRHRRRARLLHGCRCQGHPRRRQGHLRATVSVDLRTVGGPPGRYPPVRQMAKPVLIASTALLRRGPRLGDHGDIVIASDKCDVLRPHVSIGLVAGRELVRLARVLPRSVALRMALMGKHERMSVQRAYELGIDQRDRRTRSAAGTRP